MGQSMGWTPDTELEIIVERDGEEVTLSGVYGNPVYTKQVIREVESPTENQLTLRSWWLGTE